MHDDCTLALVLICRHWASVSTSMQTHTCKSDLYLFQASIWEGCALTISLVCSHEGSRGGCCHGCDLLAMPCHCCTSQLGHVCGHWQLQRLQGYQVSPSSSLIHIYKQRACLHMYVESVHTCKQLCPGISYLAVGERHAVAACQMLPAQRAEHPVLFWIAIARQYSAVQSRYSKTVWPTPQDSSAHCTQRQPRSA